MKKIIALLVLMALCVTPVMAADWSKYESGRNNIRLDGYDSQPGYIEFTDGNGTTLGYIWMSAGGYLVFKIAANVDLTTTKLSDTGATPVGHDR